MKSAIFCVLLLAFVACVRGSSHSEAPGTAEAPVSDWTDLYVFRSYEQGREDYFTILGNLYPLQAPFGGPNYFTISSEFFFEIYIDTDADCVEDFTFRFLFGSRMAGNPITHPVFPSEFNCDATGPENITISGGIELTIGSKSVAVPLKAVAPVTVNDQSGLNWIEYYTLELVTGDRDSTNIQNVTHNGGQTTFFKPFDYAGTKTFPDYESYAEQYIYNIDIPGCGTPGRVFAGQRAEAFFISLGKIFDLINLIPIPDFPGSISESNQNNDLRNINVHVLALELPISCQFIGNNGYAGVWLGTRRVIHTPGGGHVPGVQVSRLGNPLVNELVIGLRDKNKFSTEHPVYDAYFLDYVTNPTLAEIISILFRDAVNSVLGTNFPTLAPTNIPRNDLVTTFLLGFPGLNQLSGGSACEYMRFNATIAAVAAANQNRFGVIAGDNAGFPNGRRPGDDVVDIVLRVMMGRLCHLSLGLCNPSDAVVGNVDFTDGAPLSALDVQSVFPYLNTPHPGSGESQDSSANTLKPFWMF